MKFKMYSPFQLAFLLISIPAVLLTDAGAQVKVVSVEKILLNATHLWAHGQFSPDGKTVYFSTLSYDGIWAYHIDSRRLTMITEDTGAGYEFAVSSDERTIRYRRTMNQSPGVRLQQIIEKRLDTGIEEIQMSGRSIDPPGPAQRFIGSQGAPLQKSTSNSIAVKVDKMKISISRDGRSTILDPFEEGRYIWPSLSPSSDKIAAYEMGKGLFVCNLDGTVLAQLGKYGTPGWTFDGAWIVAMKDRDDGHRLISSDLVCLSPDGQTVVQLTATPDRLELYPHCSPTERKIVFHTPNGELYLLSYEDDGQ